MMLDRYMRSQYDMTRHTLIATAALLCMTFSARAEAQRPPAEIGLTDLKLDIGTMKGQTVRVTGVLQVMGEMIMLRSGPMDMSPIWVNAAKLSRVDRKALLTNCSVFCKATVIGRVGAGAFGGTGLDALTLENVVGIDANMF
jgi:hypothetical protein